MRTPRGQSHDAKRAYCAAVSAAESADAPPRGWQNEPDVAALIPMVRRIVGRA